jgi:SAM-dependent MidA family methyltransferase
MTVAAFMDLALYDPECGYYARAAQRSGRAGDFFTSVDIGPLFGELLELQLEEMFRILQQPPASSPQPPAQSPIPNPQSPQVFDLVEAGAGNGRLSADILRAARTQHPEFYRATHVHLVEASAAARATHRDTLGDAAERLASSSASLPDAFEGVLIANELLDAMAVHQVVMYPDGLREVYVIAADRADAVGRPGTSAELHTIEQPPSTPRLARHLADLGVTLEPGWCAEISLQAVDWVRDAARRLRRGFMILLDYGHEARELYSASHATGTLTTFAGHHSSGPEQHGAPVWLRNPGEQDMTAHVDFTSVRQAAEAEGMTTVALLDQTYFLLGILQNHPHAADAGRRGRQLRTLLIPGGLGSTMKVLILAKNVGHPSLQGCSFKVRMT